MEKIKVLYCVPSLYLAGGVERVITTKMNYLAERDSYDVYVVLTDGVGKDPYYKLSDRVTIIQLGLEFEELWNLSFIRKVPVYLNKQRKFKKLLKNVLFEIRPDITISTLRREINFITDIQDGSCKIGELHITRTNYRNFQAGDSNWIKSLFSKYWMACLLNKLRKLDKFIVLSDEDKNNWPELNNISVIPNPIPFQTNRLASLQSKTVLAIGRYVYSKGFDLLLKAWQLVESKHKDWNLDIYGSGNKEPYLEQMKKLGLKNVHLYSATKDIVDKYCECSLFVLSSRFEGFGMVLIEAMECGVPVVSFACPCGPRAIVQDGKNGLLATENDFSDLADKINDLISNKNKRLLMGEYAKAYSRNYDIKLIMKQWLAVFDDVLNKLDK